MTNGTSYCEKYAYFVTIKIIKKNTSEYDLNLNKPKYSSLKDYLCKEGKGTFKTSHVRGRM